MTFSHKSIVAQESQLSTTIRSAHWKWHTYSLLFKAQKHAIQVALFCELWCFSHENRPF